MATTQPGPQANRMGDPREFRGLNLLNPDEITPEEWSRHAALDKQPSGKPLPSYALWPNIGRPDVYKRWLNQVYHLHNSESMGFSAYLQYYAIAGWEDGFRYIMRGCQTRYRKDTVVEMLAATYLHSPTMGTFILAPVIEELLANYSEPAEPVAWPENWRVDPSAFDTGLDYTRPELTPDERTRIEDWYRDVTGEVPGHVRFLGEFRPQVLKAWRGRFETVVKTGLPNQAFAYLLLHYEVLRLNADGIRDYVVLARGLGMTRIQVVDCLTYGSTVFGGAGAYTLIDRVVGELLRDWRE
jgi:hypothetical protein